MEQLKQLQITFGRWLSQKQNQHIVLAGIILLGLVLRTLRMGEVSLWLDESYMYYAINEIPFNFRPDVNPPLYFSLLKVWSMIFSGKVFALRLFSIIFSLLSIFLGYKILDKLNDNKKSPMPLAGALILAVSPYFVDYGIEIRNYAMYGAMGLASVYFFWIGYENYQKTNKWNKNLTYTSLLLGLNYLNHYIAVFIAVGVSVFYLYDQIQNQALIQRLKQSLLKTIWFLFRLNLGFLIAFFSWLPFFLDYHNRLGQNADWTPHGTLMVFPRLAYQYLFGATLHMNPTPYKVGLGLDNIEWGLLAVFLFLGAWLYGMAKKQSKQKTFLIIISVISLLLMVVFGKLTGYKFHFHRYLFPYGLFWILAGVYLCHKSLPKWLSSSILALYSLFVVFIIHKPTEITPQYEKIATAVQQIEGSRILVGNYGSYMLQRANLPLIGDHRDVKLVLNSQKDVDKIVNYRLSLTKDDVIPKSKIGKNDIVIMPKISDWNQLKNKVRTKKTGGSFIYKPKQ